MQHVKAAIDELLGEIQVRQDALTALRKLIPLEEVISNGVPPAPQPVKKAALAKRKTKSKPMPKATSSPARTGQNGPSALERIAGLVVGLTQPFGTKEISAVAKLKWKAASNFITQATMKGWLKRTGHGEYERTSKFPGTPTRSGEPEIKTVLPGPGHKAAARTKEMVRRDLDAAVKDRDLQHSLGRTTMEGIAQRKVDTLEEELEALS